jgi:TPR repeat protein
VTLGLWFKPAITNFFDLYHEKTENRAIQWYLRAAMLGDADALLKLDEIFHEGLTVPDFERASRYFELADQAGNHEATAQIDLMRACGEFVKASS